jgi:hypothetical protein
VNWRRLGPAIIAVLLGTASACSAAPFAIVFKDPQSIQLVDLSTVKRAGATAAYDFLLIVPKYPDVAANRMSHLWERHEARCSTGEVRRIAMGMSVVGAPEQPRMAVEDDPCVRPATNEVRAICDRDFKPVTVGSIDEARKAMGMSPLPARAPAKQPADMTTAGPQTAVHAAVPPLGTPEGELLCAGWTNVLASGAMLTTGGDAATFIKAHGVFLGRLSVIAPQARYRLEDFLKVYDKMTPAEQSQVDENCLAKLREMGPIFGEEAETKVR